jgi:hypothetical protein
MELDLEEQEQVANLKAFWQDYGRWISIGLLIAIVGYGCYWAYSWYQSNQSLKAGFVYEQLVQDLLKNNLPEVLAKSKNIQDQYPKTAYAGMAGLMASNLAYSVADKDSAIQQLEWVALHAKSEGFQSIAKLRLVTILLDQKTPESFAKADKLLNGSMAVGFVALQMERRGDWYWAQDKTEEAKKSYLQAWNVLSEERLKATGSKEIDPMLKKLQQQNPASDQRLLKVKIESLGGF